MRKFAFASFVLVSLLFAISCKQDSVKVEDNQPVADSYGMNESAYKPDPNQVTKIYYYLPSPVEMSTLIKRSQTGFDKDLVNSLGNANKYTSELKVALNLGVYGVDLGYLKFFNDNQNSLLYLKVINQFSDQLGLPRTKVHEILTILEKNEGEQDEQLELVSKVYKDMIDDLNNSGKSNIATLIILSGWIEGLYLATSTYQLDQSNEELLHRIAEQQFSLKTIIALMGKHHDDQVLESMMSKLYLLKKKYDKVIIDFDETEAQIDTVNKVITIKGETNVGISDDDINEITRVVAKIRDEIIK